MSTKPKPDKKAAEKTRQNALRRSLLAPAVVSLSSRKFRPFTMGTLPLAEEMELSMFAPPADGEDPVEVSENEEIRQMAALAWAHDLENDLGTVVLPSLEDGSWRVKVRAYLLEHFQPGEFFALAAHMAEFQRLVREASVVVAKTGGGAPAKSVGE